MSSQPGADAPARVALSEHLQAVTEALAATHTQEEVFRVVLTPALKALDAAVGAVLLVDETGGRLETAAKQGDEQGAQTLWQDGPLDAQVPAGDALERREPLLFERTGDLTRAYPELEARTGGVAAVATAVLPMFLDERPLGAVILDFQEPHHFTSEEVRFLRILAAQCALALGRVRLLTRLQAQVQARTHESEDARARAEVLAALGDALQAARSPEDVAALALKPLGKALGASGAMVARLEDGLIRVPTVWGEVLPAMAALQSRDVPLEEATLLATCGRTGQAGYYADDNAARGGLAGLPMLAFAVEPFGGPDGMVAGFLCAWRPPQGEAWPEGERDLLRRAAGTLGLALERAQAQREAEARTRQIEEDARAQEAFVAFTETVGTETDVLALARQAVTVLSTRFPGSTSAYYTREDELWKVQAWSDDLRGELLALLRAGLPDTPLIREVLRVREAVFVDGWDAEREEVEHSQEYGAGVNVPLIVAGEVHGILALALRDTQRWTERDRAPVRAVARGLNLALERAEGARQLQLQKEAVESRNAALEAFGQLARDLAFETDRLTLVRRAQEIVRGLLPPGFAVYYELAEDRWRVRSQVDSHGSPELQVAVDAGLPHETPSLLTPFTTRQPLYQNVYPQGVDTPEEMVRHVQAVATLPLLVHGAPVGVFGVGVFEQRPWSATDRAVLETAVHHLGLALERAQQARQLETQREALAVANEELEAFSYSVSHDLRTPVRHIVGFTGLLRKTLGDAPPPKAAHYLGVVEGAAERMNTMIDALLELAHAARQPLRREQVDLEDLFGRARRDLEVDVAGQRVVWHTAPLPTVLGDRDTLRQVITNLLENALKYTRTREEACIKVWAEERPDEWAILVRDNGVGFDPRYGEKLFGVFQRLHRQEEFEGTGVGLANVRRIIARHGGRVFAEGQPGEGATFGFTLPRG